MLTACYSITATLFCNTAKTVTKKNFNAACIFVLVNKKYAALQKMDEAIFSDTEIR